MRQDECHGSLIFVTNCAPKAPHVFSHTLRAPCSSHSKSRLSFLVRVSERPMLKIFQVISSYFKLFQVILRYFQLFQVFSDLRVEFWLKTDSGYPRDAGVFCHLQWPGQPRAFLFRVSGRLMFSFVFSQSTPCLLLRLFSARPIFNHIFFHLFSESQSASCFLISFLRAPHVFSCVLSECPIFFHVFSHFFSQSQIVSCSHMSLLRASHVFSCVCSQLELNNHRGWKRNMRYGMATISRLLTIIGLFCKRAL